MSTTPLEIEGVVRGSQLESQIGGSGREAIGGAIEERRRSEDPGEHSRHAKQAWSLEGLAGRLVEITAGDQKHQGSAVTTTGLRLVRRAQLKKEPAAWVCGCQATFYPPDARRCGIDLSALPIVQLDRSAQMGKAADRLVRSGGFGLVIIDLRGAPAHSELAGGLQRRILMHAEAEDVAVVMLAETNSSLGPTVSCRIEASRRRRGPQATSRRGEAPAASRNPTKTKTEKTKNKESTREKGLFECRLEAMSDARFGPGWSVQEVVDGPPGLR